MASVHNPKVRRSLAYDLWVIFAHAPNMLQKVAIAESIPQYFTYFMQQY